MRWKVWAIVSSLLLVGFFTGVRWATASEQCANSPHPCPVVPEDFQP